MLLLELYCRGIRTGAVQFRPHIKLTTNRINILSIPTDIQLMLVANIGDLRDQPFRVGAFR